MSLGEFRRLINFGRAQTETRLLLLNQAMRGTRSFTISLPVKANKERIPVVQFQANNCTGSIPSVKRSEALASSISVSVSPSSGSLAPLLRACSFGIGSRENKRLQNLLTNLANEFGKLRRPELIQMNETAGCHIDVVVESLYRLHDQIANDSEFEPFSIQASNSIEWNKEIDQLEKMSEANIDGTTPTKLTWSTAPFLFAECYFYRKIWEIFEISPTLSNIDPFESGKKAAFNEMQEHVLAIGIEFLAAIESIQNYEETRQTLLKFLQVALWGNKCDLGMSNPQSLSATIHAELDHLRHKILANDLDHAVTGYLTNLKLVKSQRRLDIVLDNAGLEVFVDLCLADFMIEKSLADKVMFHGKKFPWFVSDTTRQDIDWIIGQLQFNKDWRLAKIGERWKHRFNGGYFQFTTDPFWTQPLAFGRMKTEATDLYMKLRDSSFIIFKGDLNYRKIVNDKHWPMNTPFRDALCGFEPAPMLTLRTIKQQTIAGLPPSAILHIRSHYAPNDPSWMLSAEYAVAQLFTGAEH